MYIDLIWIISYTERERESSICILYTCNFTYTSITCILTSGMLYTYETTMTAGGRLESRTEDPDFPHPARGSSPPGERYHLLDVMCRRNGSSNGGELWLTMVDYG